MSRTSPKRVLVMAEFKQRDLPGLTRIKFLLESVYGHAVRIAPPAAESVAVPEFRPHLVIYSHLRYPASVARAWQLKSMGIGVGVLPTEGMSALDSVRLVNAGQLTDLSPVDVHFVWNDTMAALTTSAGRLPADRVFVTGNPRFDFYFGPLNTVHMRREELCAKYGMRPERPIVTWATNFGWARLEGQDELIRDAEVRYRQEGVSHLFPWNDIPTHVRREVQCRNLQAEMFIRLAESHPDVNFVLRPHPVEDLDWYAAAVSGAGLRNVATIPKEYIWDILASTDVHLHRASCTTSHEAWLMGKPTIALLPYEDEWFYVPELAEAGDEVRSTGELCAAVDRYLAGSAVPAEQVAARGHAIEQWYSTVDGRSTERHAAVIDAFLQRHTQEPKVTHDREFFKERGRELVRRMLGVGEHGSIRARLRGQASDTRDKFVTSRDVDEWLAKIRFAEAARP